MIRRVALAACAFALATGAHAATGRCLLEVKGRAYLKGPCEIDLFDGGFSIGTGDAKRAAYFAYVLIDSDDKSAADGSWNKDPEATHAHSPLGRLKRDGACWTNATAKVCAWK